MRKRYEAVVALLPRLKPTFAPALREVLDQGYGKRDLIADASAGVIVGLVALPLAMALGIAAGATPQAGIYTAIIAGLVVALLGGSRVQVSGPTASFVILAPISAQYGLGGLAVATLMAGVILAVMGLARLGRLVQFIPHPVTTGFTAGIALTIAVLQLKDFFGLPAVAGSHVPERLWATMLSIDQASWPDLAVGVFTLIVLLVWPRLGARRTVLPVPAPLVALALAAVVGVALAHFFDASCATIQTRFASSNGIPQAPPLPLVPWAQPGAGGQTLTVNLALLRELAGPAFAIAMLCAIESLLTAVVSDGIMGTRHDPDAELFAQGVGNIAAPFFGGIAATGAMARTATCIRAGARSPLAAVVHSLFVLVSVVALAPLLGYLPMASLAALLLLVAWNMSEAKHFVHILRVAPRADVVVLLTCFTLTVVFDMVVAVATGVLMAALLFMQRMADTSTSRLIGTTEHSVRLPGLDLPRDVLIYEIAGPLFFGAAQKAMSALDQVASKKLAVILDMSAVPAMDATGLVALESVLARLWRDRSMVIVAGVQRQPRELLERAGLVDTEGKLAIRRTLSEAVDLARTLTRTTTGSFQAVTGD
jgi:SulP family sulfate permease